LLSFSSEEDDEPRELEELEELLLFELDEDLDELATLRYLWEDFREFTDYLAEDNDEFDLSLFFYFSRIFLFYFYSTFLLT
jgi:hypothetical protein